MRLKLLTVLISIALMPTFASAAEVKATETDANKAKSDAQNASSDVKTLHDTKTQPPAPTYVQPVMPTARIGSWRFGLWRTKRGGYYHKGLDFSGAGSNGYVEGDKVLFSSSGTIIQKDTSQAAMTVQRLDNGDRYTMLHAKRRTPVPRGKDVRAGDFALMMGNTDASGGGVGQKSTASAYAKHLHYEYHVRYDSGRQRWVGLGGSKGETTKGRGITFHPNTMGSSSGFSGAGYVVTDPAPYLKNDVIFNGTYTDALLDSYIGTSIRTQYNTLYNPKIPLAPLHPKAKTPTRKFANLPYFKDFMTPEDIAALAGGAVNASMYADGAGYGINGELMSQRMIASFISASDGANFSTLPPAPAAVLSEMTPQEIIKNISFQRYGNQDWEAAMIKLSSKGLLTEYLMMTAEENFLRQQNQRLKNRVELQLATLNQANLFEYNKKIEAMNLTVEADSVPRIIDRELENLGGGYYYDSRATDFDVDNLPADLEGLINSLMEALTLGESENAGAWNNGECGVSAPSGGKGKNIEAMTPRQLILSYYSYYKGPPQVIPWKTRSDVPCSRRIMATGRWQTMPSTLSEMIMKAPQFVDMPYTSENQFQIAKEVLLKKSIHKSLRNFLKNGGSDKEMMDAMLGIAYTWSSIGDPRHYPNYEVTANKKGGNRAFKEPTLATLAVMKRIQQYHNGALAQSSTPSTGTGTATGGANTSNPASNTTGTTKKP